MNSVPEVLLPFRPSTFFPGMIRSPCAGNSDIITETGSDTLSFEFSCCSSNDLSSALKWQTLQSWKFKEMNANSNNAALPMY